MLRADFVIVGSGLTGSTIARLLADHEQDVLVIDRKDHIAGNVYDYRHESGAMIHKYGPHYFRCGSEKIWNFLNRFSEFYDWAATLRSKVNGEYLNWPVSQDYIEKIAGKEWDLFKGEASNFEEAGEMVQNKIPVLVANKVDHKPAYVTHGVSNFAPATDGTDRLLKVSDKSLTTSPKVKWQVKPLFYNVAWVVGAAIAGVLITYLLGLLV